MIGELPPGHPPIMWETELEMFNSACRAIVKDVLSLAPEYAPQAILDYENSRPFTTPDGRRAATRAVIDLGKKPSDRHVIHCSLNAVNYANSAIRQACESDDGPCFYDSWIFRLMGGQHSGPCEATIPAR